MKKIFILLASMFLLNGCVESMALLSGATNGKLVQSSVQQGLSYGVKKQTGKTPFQHALALSKKKRILNKKEDCSSFADKKDLDICLMVKERIISKQAIIKKNIIFEKPPKNYTSSLRSSIDEKSKTKYLD